MILSDGMLDKGGWGKFDENVSYPYPRKEAKK